MKPSIVITGASGYVGQYLLKSFDRCLFAILGVSRTPLTNCLQVKSYSDTPNADILIHLAQNNQNPEYDQNSNGNVCDKTTKSLSKKKFKLIIYLSSSMVYETTSNGKLKESSKLNTSNGYSCYKVRTENIFLNSCNCVILRSANLFGTKIKQKNVIYDILTQVYDNKNIVVRNGNPVRDFLHVSDIAGAIQSAILQGAQGIYNIGSGVGTSILNLAYEIRNISNKKHLSIHSLAKMAKGQSQSLVLDVSKAKRDLNWEPKIDLHTGLRDLLL